MKLNVVHFVSCALLTALAGCSSDSAPEAPGFGTGDGGPSGRTTIEMDAQADVRATTDVRDAPMGALPEGVKITVTAKTPATGNVFAPLTGSIVLSKDNFTPVVDVVVEADSLLVLDGVAIDDVYAEIEVPNAVVPQTAIKLGQSGTPKRGPDGKPEITYSFGDILVPIGKLQSGDVNLKISVTTKGITTTTKFPFKIDAGPTIEFVSPKQDKDAFKNSALISVKITDAIFSPLKDISISLGDTPQAMTNPEPGLYVATIDFKAFSPKLSGRQLVSVRASNSNKTITVASREFYADDQGPSFEMLTPIKGQLIGGLVEISAVVIDPAGVNPASVIAVVGNGAGVNLEVRLNPPAVGDPVPKYSSRFDAKLLPPATIFPSLSFRATDKLGNESTEGYSLSLDNTPPLLDLDPPDNMRMLQFDATYGYQCSWPLDPVGPDAVDDGQYVNQAFDVRVRAEDQGNAVLAGNIDFVPIGGLKNVSLIALSVGNTSRALVVDTDKNGSCDSMNPLLVPTSRPMSSNQVLLLNMDSLPSTGVPDTMHEFPEPIDECQTTRPGATTPVEPLCGGAGATYNPFKTRYAYVPGQVGFLGPTHSNYMSTFITYTQDKIPSIWTLGPVRAGVECAGRQLESVGSNLNDGWACIAAMGEDTLGTKQVSRPIRVCIDKDAQGNECPHRKVVGMTNASPIEIETEKDNGFVTGEEVFIQNTRCQTGANGKHKIKVVSPRKFTLDGVAALPLGCTYQQYHRDGEVALVAATKEMPNCTGTQTAPEPMTIVNEAKACTPWRAFPDKEQRILK